MPRVLHPLPADWNTYGAPAISQETIDAARAALKTILPTGVPWPDEVPTSNGGVQFEWHRNGVYIDVEVGKSLFACRPHTNAKGFHDVLVDDERWYEETPDRLAALLKECICK